MDDTPHSTLPPQAVLYQLASGHYISRALELVARLGIADIPLLYETGHERDFASVIVTSCSPEQQLERLRARHGYTEAAAKARLAAQMPVSEKAARATFVIDTSGTLDETHRQVEEIYGALRSIVEI